MLEKVWIGVPLAGLSLGGVTGVTGSGRVVEESRSVGSIDGVQVG